MIPAMAEICHTCALDGLLVIPYQWLDVRVIFYTSLEGFSVVLCLTARKYPNVGDNCQEIDAAKSC